MSIIIILCIEYMYPPHEILYEIRGYIYPKHEIPSEMIEIVNPAPTSTWGSGPYIPS
jgi:hypothetical protein